MSELRFKFGQNWQRYLDAEFSEESYGHVKQSMTDFLGTVSLTDKTFLDVGCGSGVHSLAASELGAAKLVSIDYDQDSVSCTTSLRGKSTHKDWNVQQGSLLDRACMESLGQFDVVYCWGVAHHTGDMWTGLEHLARAVKPDGYLVVAIYNTLPGGFGSRWWHRVKKLYVSMPRPFQVMLEYGYFGLHFFRILSRGKNPFRVMRAYKKKRGMSYYHDLVDWLGGFPYEHAKAEEIFRFYHDTHAMELLNLKTSCFLGNNQFLFKKTT